MRTWWLLAVAAVGAGIAAAPILGNYFYQDDFGNFYEVANFGLRDFLVGTAAGHMYVVRNALFYVLFLLFRLESTPVFTVVLATHVANVLLLFALVRRLTGSAGVACFGALLFGVAPTNDGTLGWYAVYGQAMAVTFVLAALLLLAPRPGDEARLGVGRALAVAACMLVASQCFGSGAAAALVIPLVAVLVRPSSLRAPRALLVLCALPVLVLGMWYAMHSGVRRLNQMPIGGAEMATVASGAFREATISHMLRHIAAIGTVSLVAGPAYPLVPYPDAGAPMALALVAVVAVAFASGEARTRRLLAAFGGIALVCYGVIAAARGPVFAALRPDELLRAYVDAPRYHYLAQMALAVVAALVVGEADRRLRWPTPVRRVLLALWVLWAVAGTLWLRPPTLHWEHERALVARIDEGVRARVRAQAPGTTVCIPNEPAPLTLAFPGSAGVYVMLYPDDTLEGRRVFFTADNPKMLAFRDAGGRLAGLLGPSSACPR